MRRIVLLLVAVVMLISACGSSDPEIIGIRASSDPAVGDSRFLFAVNQIDGIRRGGPDEVVAVTASSLAAPDIVHEVEAEFVWIVPNGFGVYKAEIPWDVGGQWELDFTISTGEPTQPFLVYVADEPATAPVGDAAPLVGTPTVDDTAVEDLSTDDPLDERFYQLSLDDALTNGNKTVAIFATPAFCTSAACGPMMNQVKELAGAYADVNWVHVEVYEGFNEPDFVPNADHLAPAVVEFGLPSEPWIFVMDEQGVVTARLEGVLAPGELEALLDA